MIFSGYLVGYMYLFKNFFVIVLNSGVLVLIGKLLKNDCSVVVYCKVKLNIYML